MSIYIRIGQHLWFMPDINLNPLKTSPLPGLKKFILLFQVLINCTLDTFTKFEKPGIFK
jgi:hypothetical protein